MSRKLYVGNLPYQTDEQALQDMFGRIGTVDSVYVARDQATGQARGFAFVEMATEQDAADAAAQLNGQELGGRTLKVNEARPKPQGGGGFNGGGGFGSGGGGKRTRREPRW